MNVHLSIFINSKNTKEIPLFKQTTTIGRMSCDIILPDLFVSLTHMSIYKRYDSIIIKDMNSTHGSFLNDEPITTPQFLHIGDIISIHPYKIKLCLSPEKEKTDHSTENNIYLNRSMKQKEYRFFENRFIPHSFKLSTKKSS